MKTILKIISLLCIILFLSCSNEDTNDEHFVNQHLSNNNKYLLRISSEINLEGSEPQNVIVKNNDVLALNYTITEQESNILSKTYGLESFGDILQIHAVFDNSKNENINLNDSFTYLVYSKDVNDYVTLNIIEPDGTITTKKDISFIYGRVIENLLFSKKSIFRTKPILITIDVITDAKSLKWVQLSEDSTYKKFSNFSISSYNKSFDTRGDIEISDGGGCTYRCSGDGDECSPWNPGVCGSVCQIFERTLRLDNDPEDNIATSLLKNMSSYYKIRDELNVTSRGKELVNNYYNFGSIIFSGKVDLPLSLQSEIFIKILDKHSSILKFINNKRSNEIFYTKNEGLEYIQLINNLKTLSNDTNFNFVLDYFNRVISTNSDKTINEIHRYLHN